MAKVYRLPQTAPLIPALLKLINEHEVIKAMVKAHTAIGKDPTALAKAFLDDERKRLEIGKMIRKEYPTQAKDSEETSINRVKETITFSY